MLIEARNSADSSTHVVLLTELFAERGAHDCASDAGRGIVMGLARLSARGVEGCHCQFCDPAHSINSARWRAKLQI